MTQALEPGIIPVPDTPSEDEFTFVDASANPMAAMAAAAGAADEQKNDDVPLIGEPGDTTVRLPGGYLDDVGVRHLSAEVRELTGEDEEALARAAAGNSLLRYQQVLLERGVVAVGTHAATVTLINSLLAGDRDTLMLGIRVATYGKDVDVDVKCPVCAVEAHIKVDALQDVKVERLSDTGPEYTVELRGGHAAKVRLVIGSDLNSLDDHDDATVAEQNTLLLSRCVLSVDGQAWKPGSALQKAKAMGMSDRRTILAFLSETQPGPQFGDVKYACTACGKEMTLGLGVADLFPR